MLFLRDRKIVPIFVFFALFAVMLQGCATTPTGVSEQNLLSALCERNNISWQLDSVTQVIVLHGINLEAKGLVGSNMVILGTEKVTLSEPIKRMRNNIIVPADFEKLVITRLKADIDLSLIKFKKIIIDAGHGGKDPGAIGKSGLQEKTVNLDLALKLRDILISTGRDVLMTRETDEFLTLEKRTEIAAASNADLFISVHANSHRSKSVHGIEIYSAKDNKTEVEKEDQYKKNKQIFFTNKIVPQSADDVEKILLDMLYSYKQAESRNLASFAVSNVSMDVGMKNEGSKSANFFVLRNTFIPAILVEVGYLSNAGEEKLLQTSAYRASVADAIAKTVLNYEKY